MISALYSFLPQHFLYLRPLPHTHGSFRPSLGVPRVIGLCGGGQQLVLVQLELVGAGDLSVMLYSFFSRVYHDPYIGFGSKNKDLPSFGCSASILADSCVMPLKSSMLSPT